MVEGVGEVSGLSLLGSIPRLRQNHVLEYERLFAEHGNTVRFGWPLDYVLVFHPSDVEQVLRKNARNYRKSRTYLELKPLLGEGLITAEGETWRRHRRIVAREFTQTRALDHVGEIARVTDRWLNTLDAGPVRVDVAVQELVLSLAAVTLFGSRHVEDAREVSAQLDAFMDRYVERSYSLVKLPRWLPTAAQRRMNASVRALTATMERVVGEARVGADAGSNVLTRLLETRNGEHELLDDAAVRDELVTLLMAGHETTANALNWTLYLLGRHPEVQGRVRAEARRVLDSAPPTRDSVRQLAFCKMCLLESMRLYPPVVGVSRDAIGPDVLRDVAISPDSRVEVSMWVTHRHPDFWEDPQRFDPERFSSNKRDQIVPFSYFPFGGGPRTCIGEAMSLTQLQVILATLVQRFDWESLGAALGTRPTVTLRPARPLRLNLRAL